MFLRTAGHSTEVEVVVVDDGSTDATSEVIREFSQGKDGYHVLRTGARPVPPAPATAERPMRPANSCTSSMPTTGSCRRKLALALKVLQDPTVMFLKTGVRTSDPVHPEWKQRIANSVVINLCVRRRCHDFIGGFLDYQLVHRQGDGFGPALDVFYKTEDMYYNLMLHSLFRGAHSDQDTVEYRRYPGNSFDRRYEEFCRPPRRWDEPARCPDGPPAPSGRFHLQL